MFFTFCLYTLCLQQDSFGHIFQPVPLLFLIAIFPFSPDFLSAYMRQIAGKAQSLDMITTRAGYVKLIGQTLFVILDWIENNKHRKAAEKFCRLLNKKAIKLVGRLNVKLSFHISKIPHHAVSH